MFGRARQTTRDGLAESLRDKAQARHGARPGKHSKNVCLGLVVSEGLQQLHSAWKPLLITIAGCVWSLSISVHMSQHIPAEMQCSIIGI